MTSISNEDGDNGYKELNERQKEALARSIEKSHQTCGELWVDMQEAKWVYEALKRRYELHYRRVYRIRRMTTKPIVVEPGASGRPKTWKSKKVKKINVDRLLGSMDEEGLASFVKELEGMAKK
jgi:hypothetical protein